jgi:hypothetical protein
MTYPPVYAVCAADSSVQSLLGTAPTRFWPFGEANPAPEYPYAVWQLVTGTPQNYLGQAPDMDSFGIQIDVYAESATSAREVAHALRSAIEAVAYVTAYIGEFRDTITRSFRYSFSADWLVPR